MLGVVMGHVKFPNDPKNEKSKIRPFYAWGNYFDKNNNLRAIDCFTATRQPTKFNQLHLNSDINQSMGGQGSASLSVLNDYYFLNKRDTLMDWKNKNLPTTLLPDIILRRVSDLLYSPSTLPQDVGLYKKNKGWVRHGLVFNTIKTQEVQECRECFAPEVSDAPFEQVPFEIPNYLEQQDIDNICLIARHYLQYCLEENKFPLFWPEQGTWGHWPDELMRFIEPQSSSVRLPWLGGKDFKAGFPVDLSHKQITPSRAPSHYRLQNHPASP